MDNMESTSMTLGSHDQGVELQTDVVQTIDLKEMVWFHAKVRV